MTALLLDYRAIWGNRPGNMSPTWVRSVCLATPPGFSETADVVQRMSARTFYGRYWEVMRMVQWAGFKDLRDACY